MGRYPHQHAFGTNSDEDLAVAMEAMRLTDTLDLAQRRITEISGGEAQRLKITSELCRKDRGETLYILDEPTVGQHMEDLSGLVRVLDQLVEGGNTVVAIEHHPHFLACCDWLVELGPGAGSDGGRIIAEGSPESLAQKETPTSPYLREAMRIG